MFVLGREMMSEVVGFGSGSQVDHRVVVVVVVVVGLVGRDLIEDKPQLVGVGGNSLPLKQHMPFPFDENNFRKLKYIYD